VVVFTITKLEEEVGLTCKGQLVHLHSIGAHFDMATRVNGIVNKTVTHNDIQYKVSHQEAQA